MSTDHQQYSILNQSAAIKVFADANGMEVIRTYADAGKSGTSIRGRNGLKSLLRDVQAPKLDFKFILVLDISRWGRYADTDESAHYEFICKAAGAPVLYVATPHLNVDSPVTPLLKSAERWTQSGYSIQLSNKVFAGHCTLFNLGFHQGGMAGFGLRRQLISHLGHVKGILQDHERKALQFDRIVLVPGPQEETAIISEIFDRFTVRGQSPKVIAEQLNESAARQILGRPWTSKFVLHLLNNERFIALNIWNRRKEQKSGRIKRNPPDAWMRSSTGREPIVDGSLWSRAQSLIKSRMTILTDGQMLASLAKLYERLGRITASLINATEGMPRACAYASRFGGLIESCRLIGYRHPMDDTIERRRAFLRRIPETFAEIKGRVEAFGAQVDGDPDKRTLKINGLCSMAVYVIRHIEGDSKGWRLKLEADQLTDFYLVVRLQQDQSEPLDYFMFSRIHLPHKDSVLGSKNSRSIDAFRFADLSPVHRITSAFKVERRVS